MGPFQIEPGSFRIFAEAVGLGLLVGAERYRSRDENRKGAAGVRTFTLFALLGALCGLVDVLAITVVTFAAMTGLLWIAYRRSSPEHPGLTTEIAALLVFWLGFLLHTHEGLAIGTAIVLTVLLASKGPIHDFVRKEISETEFVDTLKFLAVVLVVYPLLPERDMGPYEFFNPRQIWGLVVLVSTIGYVGYILMRWLGRRRGLALSGLLGGLVSTVAVTQSLAERARGSPQTSRICGEVAVMANAMQFPRLLFLVWVVERSLGLHLAAPFAAAAAVGLLGSGLLWWLRRSEDQPGVKVSIKNPFSLRPALRFGLMFVVILFVVQVAEAYLGDRGIYLAAAVTGMGSVSAISLSVARLVEQGSLAAGSAAVAVLIGLATNMAVKWTIARLNGTAELAWRLGGGLLLMVGVAGLGIWLAG